jgi:hypothetical protein
MDRAEALVAIAGMITGVLVISAIVWGVVEHARVKLRGERGNPALAGELAALREQVDLLQQQVAETQERLDFTERLLAQGRTDTALGRGP